MWADVTSGEKKSGLEEVVSLLRQAVENSYVCSYDALGNDSHNAEAMDYIGLTQLLSQNYWSGHYHCCRSAYLGRERDRLNEIVERLEGYRSEDGGGVSEAPLYPFDDSNPVSPELADESYERVLEHGEEPDSQIDELQNVSEANLRLASNLVRLINSHLDEVPPENGVESLYHAYSRLLSMQPSVSRSISEEVDEVTPPSPFYAGQIEAYSHAMEGEYLEAGEAFSEIPEEILEEGPELVDEGYRCYQNSGSGERANKFAETTRVPGSIGEYYPDTKHRMVQLSGRLRGSPPILISTISKSGSTFLTSEIQKRTLSGYMKIMTGNAYDDKKILSQPMRRFAKGGLVCRQHFHADDDILSTVSSHGIDRIVFHIRDPRRALISWVFYQESTLRKNVRINRKVRGTEPREYANLDFEGKIENQIENFLEPTIEMIESWIEAEKNGPYGIKIKITRFEDMISDTDSFFDDVLSFYGVSHRPIIKSLVEGARRQSEHNKNKKRGGDIDEWEELISDPLKQKVLDAIPSSITSMYPEKDWTV